MSESVEVVRAVYEALDPAGVRGEGDLGVADLFDPSFELRPPEQSPDVQSYRGFEGLLAYLRMQLDLWDEASFEAERFLDGGSRVVVFTRVSVRGKGSGVPVTISSAHVWTLCERRALSMEIYPDRRAALEAAGIEAPAPDDWRS
jgi:ketosteroid isomerase-like protein